MTHELGPGRRFKSQLGEWYERDQVAAEVARAVAAERERWTHVAKAAQSVTEDAKDRIEVFEVPAHLMAALALALDEASKGAQAHGQTPGSLG